MPDPLTQAIHAMPKKRITRVLMRLLMNEELSTRDFKDMGWPFELFLRYVHMSDAHHVALHAHTANALYSTLNK
jgi:hypothetical protein